ncbi:MAG: anthranilate synthase component I family protein [Ruminiclostridium sp.]
MSLTASRIGMKKALLGLDNIYTYKQAFDCKGIDLIDIYEKNKKIQTGGSFIIEMPYREDRISIICCEALCSIQSDGEDISVFDSRGQLVHHEKDDPLVFLRNVERLFENRLVGSDEIAQSIFLLISYDAVRQFEKKKLNKKVIIKKVPDFWAVIPKSMIIVNHGTRESALYINCFENAFVEESVNETLESYLYGNSNNSNWEDVKKKSEGGTGEPVFNFTEEEFCKTVEKAKEYIRAGDIFQVVLSVECAVKTQCSAEALYKNMIHVNCGTANYLIQSEDFSVIGASPEILVEKTGSECIIKPLAGTMLYDGIKDAKKERTLLDSEKDCAEHRMLVDLARNDLGRVCRYNTVVPKKLMEIEYYYNVMHIVSEIKGIIDEEKDSYDLLRASFPAGTMAGAPKIRAMEIIDELENTIRGFYSGGVGFFTSSGNLYTYIIIRSLTLIKNIAYARAGAGIVYDSIPAEEYKECLNKLKNALRALKEEN